MKKETYSRALEENQAKRGHREQKLGVLQSSNMETEERFTELRTRLSRVLR